MKYVISLFLLLYSFGLWAEDKAFAPQTSELFVDLTHPKVLYAKHASLALIPASVTKLFVAASALKQWGSYHTFATEVYQRGQWKQGVLIGDLVFYGQGDPAFDETGKHCESNAKSKSPR
ncbi:D-alanyl-D-alanine carboxypeptidase [Rickettsiella endosymbiont of Dermanyssus gallinae]|uniref:D-alanyl-D-alanine carboxypeptidase n=1 Tax=Rickettsiella endosymbiont of Dermanyssus gallinae TaxID=2856608 RepID=UPI001C528482|nr:D-alanyl-D-alanine carboxypeptidase [Rickettsiella endosymbiont of Dermanyssus gallinae]